MCYNIDMIDKKQEGKNENIRYRCRRKLPGVWNAGRWSHSPRAHGVSGWRMRNLCAALSARDGPTAERPDRALREESRNRNELIVTICREAGDVGTDDEIVEGYSHNYNDGYLQDVVDPAAAGDVAALVRMRSDA